MSSRWHTSKSEATSEITSQISRKITSKTMTNFNHSRERSNCNRWRLANCYAIATCCLLALIFSSTQQTNSQALASTEYVQNYLLYTANKHSESSSDKNKEAQQQLEINRLLKDTNHSHVSDAVDLKLANLVWSRMRQHALSYARDNARAARPTINALLERAQVSQACSSSLNGILDHLAQLDQWAVEMYNAWGDFPANGFFEGSFTSMGAYHQCVNARMPVELNHGKPQYCTLKFQPIVPKRPRYHNILATIDQLANFTSPSDVSVVRFVLCVVCCVHNN